MALLKNLSTVIKVKTIATNNGTEEVEESKGLQSSFEVEYFSDIISRVLQQADANQTFLVRVQTNSTSECIQAMTIFSS